MTVINQLNQCQNAEQFEGFINQLKPYIPYLGGRRFTIAGQAGSVCLNDLVKKISSLPIDPYLVGSLTTKIWRLDQEAGIKLSQTSLLVRIFTFFRQYIGNWNYVRSGDILNLNENADQLKPDYAKNKLEEGICLTQEMMDGLENAKQVPKYHANGNYTYFKLEDLHIPYVFYHEQKNATDAQYSHLTRAGNLQAIRNCMIRVKGACLALHTRYVSIPGAKLLVEPTYSVLVQQSLGDDVIRDAALVKKRFRELGSRLNPALVELVRVIHATNLSCVSNNMGVQGDKILILNPRDTEGAERGIASLISHCMTPEQVDTVVAEAERLKIPVTNKVSRLEELDKNARIKDFHSRFGITDVGQPIKQVELGNFDDQVKAKSVIDDINSKLARKDKDKKDKRKSLRIDRNVVLENPGNIEPILRVLQFHEAIVSYMNTEGNYQIQA